MHVAGCLQFVRTLEIRLTEALDRMRHTSAPAPRSLTSRDDEQRTRQWKTANRYR